MARDPSPPAAPSRAEIDDIFARAEKGDASVLPALQRVIRRNPKYYESLGDAAGMAEHALLKLASGSDLATYELVKRRLASVRAELAGPSPSPLERLLAERAALCWLDANLMDAIYGAGAPFTKQAEFDGRARERAHRRFLHAVKTLAAVRKMALPAIQVNIAEKQVNLAGR